VPAVAGFGYVPLNDLDAVKAATDDETCAVMLEPLQGEGGINLPTAEFMAGLRQWCDENGMLLILDEVQTGIGRTGEWFGYQHYDMVPDIVTLAKALGSGFPIGAIIARPEIAASLVPGTHASTFGGNPLACAAALATLRTIEDEGLLDTCRTTSAYILERLAEMAGRYPIICEVRGRGVMIGIDLTRPGAAVFSYCLEQGVRINCTHETVVRMLPAMNIPRDVLDEGMAVLDTALAKAQEGEI
jgi:acetylornithine/succinyldiaminopimelate/putrescine aminotransferase